MADTVTLTDNELIERFIAGCGCSFEALMSRYETKVYSLAMRLTRNAEDAEEVLQDVFVTVYRKIAGFEGKAKFSSWLYRITVNAAFMKLRKRKQKQDVVISDALPQTPIYQMDRPEDRADSRALKGELRGVLSAAIERLPADYQAVFVLRDVDGLSNEEVSGVLNLTLPAVKSRLHRSRMMLRKRLQRFYTDYTSEKRVLGVGPQMIRQAA